MPPMPGKTLYDKIWDAHVVAEQDGEAILYIDLHLIHEVTSPQAFAGLRANHRPLRRPDLTLAVADHNIPTEGQALGVDAVADEEARIQLQTLARNVKDNGIEFFPMGEIGTGGGTGKVIEYAGPAIQALSMEGRMTLCNLSIEGGAKAGIIAPDETTFAYIQGKPGAPKGAAWDMAVDYWKSFFTDADA